MLIIIDADDEGEIMASEFGSDLGFRIVVERDSSRVARLLRFAFRTENAA